MPFVLSRDPQVFFLQFSINLNHVRLPRRNGLVRLHHCLLDLLKYRLPNTSRHGIPNLLSDTRNSPEEAVSWWEASKACQLVQIETPLSAWMKVAFASTRRDALAERRLIVVPLFRPSS